MRFKTIFLSDLHLLSCKTNIDNLETLFDRCEIEKIHCVGDFIDCWRLFSKELKDLSVADTDRQIRIFRKILKKLETYVYGNHDDVLHRLTHFGTCSLGSVEICEDKVVDIGGYPAILVHGHQWDFIVRNSRWLAKTGDRIHHFAIKLNSIYNLFRRYRHPKKNTLSVLVKKLGKSYLRVFSDNCIDFACKNNCSIVIVGHTHTCGHYYDESRRCLYINTGCFTTDASTFLGSTKDDNLYMYEIKDQKISRITPNLLELLKNRENNACN